MSIQGTAVNISISVRNIILQSKEQIIHSMTVISRDNTEKSFQGRTPGSGMICTWSNWRVSRGIARRKKGLSKLLFHYLDRSQKMPKTQPG